MRIYHPKHGILHVSDQAEIKRLLETGGEEFNVHDKPWQRKNEIKEDTKTNEAVENSEVLSAPRRGRPAKHGDN